MHTGGQNFPKINKRTCTTIQDTDTRVLTHILNHCSNLAMKNMTKDTATPANIIKIQTLADNGDIKENKSTAFSGALTYNTLIPVNKII